MEMGSTKPQLRVLLDHLGTIKDSRQPWKVAYPLREVLFPVVCGTIACGDDYGDIVDWGEAHLSFLRRSCEFQPRHPVRRLAADRHGQDWSGAVCSLLFVVGGRMLAGQARPRGH